jgi:hypothetical protein
MPATPSDKQIADAVRRLADGRQVQALSLVRRSGGNAAKIAEAVRAEPHRALCATVLRLAAQA